MKWIFISLSLLSFTAHSIVIRHDVSDTEYLANKSEFPPLATFYKDGAHGTLIKPNWVITAAHATFCLKGGSNVLINDQIKKIKNVYIHKDYQVGQSHDIALVELSQSVNDIRPTALYYEHDEKGKALWFIGIGGTGNGNTGQTIDNYENAGILRKAQNVVEVAAGSLLKFIFNNGKSALPYEGVSGSGDSGGPAYFYKDGIPYLVGVSSRVEGEGIGKYGVTEVYSRISFFNQWIQGVISGNESVRFKISINKLRQLPTGLTDENLSMVCEDISFTEAET